MKVRLASPLTGMKGDKCRGNTSRNLQVWNEARTGYRIDGHTHLLQLLECCPAHTALLEVGR
jgi:hypothetical protein